MNRFSESEAGFSLLEVIIAITILGIAMVVILQCHMLSMALVERSVNNTRAMLLAESKVAEVEGRKKQVSGEDSGTFDDFPRFGWSARVDDMDMGEDGIGKLFRVKVNVFPRETSSSGEAEIVTYLYAGEKDTKQEKGRVPFAGTR